MLLSQSPFSAKGATDTSLGQRPRGPGKAPRSVKGLKARPMHAPRRFGDPGVRKTRVAWLTGVFVVCHAFLGRWPRLG